MSLYIDQSTLDTLVAQALPTVSDAHKDAFQQFIYSYYKTLSQATFEESEPALLAGRALAHFALWQRYNEQGNAQIVLSNEGDVTVLQMVAKDRPFLSDTLLMSLDKQGVNVYELASTIITPDLTVAPQSSLNANNTALITIIMYQQQDLESIKVALLDKIATLDMIVSNYHAMQSKLQAVRSELASQSLPDSEHSSYEILSFLDWIDNNFIFMGYREYRFYDSDGKKELYSVGGTGLGLLAGQQEDTLSESFHRLPETLKHLLTLPRVLLLSKSAHLSPIHRPVYMDFLGVQKFDDNGQVIGEYRFLGLLTSRAYQTQVSDIPLLREKAQSILAKTGLVKNSHAYTKVAHVINTLPRDDLFQGGIDELTPIVVGIAGLQDKNTLRLFARTDHYNRFVSCLVYIPKHKFDTKLRMQIQDTLMQAFNGTSSAFTTDFNDLHHTRVHFHIRTTAGQINSVDLPSLEQKLATLMHDFGDEFSKIARSQKQSKALIEKILPSIPLSYQEKFSVKTAISDGTRLLQVQNDPLWYMHEVQSGDDSELILKVYGKDTPATLSQILPMLEDFGVNVLSAQTYEFAGVARWLQVYRLHPETTALDSEVALPQMEEALGAIWSGVLESDKLNTLILTSKLDGFDVLVLRALSRYMIQATAPFSVDYIHDALLDNVAITEQLIALFHAKFDPNQQQDTKALLDGIETALAQVKSLDEDRIIRWLLELLQATLRTNFYQVDEMGARKDRLSFKFQASKIAGLPKPKPMFEIYVYSPQTEGVHLRGGKVARGGLRWSDRMEDYRTEVLGLVKAQMVKNAVIVPVGSKGGFVVKDKSQQGDREAWQQAGIACYKTYIRGLLDLTDNLVDGNIVPPANTVRLDEDDPYLVVAADKGTATFSDIANGLSAEYNFWLQDAFASGGSAGYDHKGMGITARGAWESVKRHFRLLGKDIQRKDDFTVMGIGDMSGDVFGNGMLLSKHIKLVAAFNHLHIFIDPNPDTAVSFAERERLFNLPRSQWTDYDNSLISAGGGVFSRQDKAITISQEMKARFAISEDSLTPNELLHKLLKAPVDLLWNGGIGTYIKAHDETHAAVGDRANDAIRVDGKEVQALVVGEGGNLGATQRGRIEYALAGGQIYTDAIDNSAGVNCSDHEVNIKILLGNAVQRGELSLEERNALLASMTDSVTQLVLRQNYLQPEAIELSNHQSLERLDDNARFMRFLEDNGRLDRGIEFLPNDNTLQARKASGQGLTNPELAILLAYGKMWVYDEMLASDLPNDPYFLAELKKYFPDTLAQAYFEDMVQHRLHREIICTYLTNGLVNRLGIENVFSLYSDNGVSIADMTRAYAVTRDIFAIQVLWDKLASLDNVADAKAQLAIELNIRKLLKSAMQWLLDNTNLEDIDALGQYYRANVLEILDDVALLSQFDDAASLAQSAELVEAGVDKDSAELFARLPYFVDVLDIVDLAKRLDTDKQSTASDYFAVYDLLGLDKLFIALDKLPKADYWDRRAATALANELRRTLLSLSAQAANAGGVETWQADNTQKLTEVQEQIDKLDTFNLAALSVVLSQINGLVQA